MNNDAHEVDLKDAVSTIPKVQGCLACENGFNMLILVRNTQLNADREFTPRVRHKAFGWCFLTQNCCGRCVSGFKRTRDDTQPRFLIGWPLGHPASDTTCVMQARRVRCNGTVQHATMMPTRSISWMLRVESKTKNTQSARAPGMRTWIQHVDLLPEIHS